MLPLVSYEAYGKVYSWPLERVVEVLSVRAQHALPRTSWRRFPLPLGRNVVFALGEAFVLKLVPPFWAHDAAALRAVCGRLSVVTPEVVGVGSLEDGWAYLVTRSVPGRQIDWAFQDLPEDARVGRVSSRRSKRVSEKGL